MGKYDILQDLSDGNITVDDADDICSSVLADTRTNTPAHEILGMSQREWTAYAHGVEFRDLANWRIHGWPNRCFICGQPIDLDNFGWLAREHDGRLQIKHVVCPRVP